MIRVGMTAAEARAVRAALRRDRSLATNPAVRAVLAGVIARLDAALAGHAREQHGT